MSSRTAKKHANEKISLDNINKKGRKKEELVASFLADDLNDFLNNEEAQQSKSKDLNEDEQNENSQNDDEFVLSTRKIIPDLRANNPINQINDIPSNRLIPVLESRNEITPSNSTSKMISAIPDSRVNSPFGHITLRNSRPRLTPLNPRDNTINIGHNIYNTSQYNFNMTDEDVLSPFNEMMIYQLCSWLCVNPNILQLANNMHLSMQMPVVDRNLANPLQKEEIITFVDEFTSVHVLSQ
ncbi:hypothetical protein C1645_735384 [Glomus cerebriforme]|uniref:Uncharacterized protein n=1 Tax=Glomus cerebriforme TaxID=658196 RepID=A0A397T8F6_9GLOM|nr:hypothetical protein C1645_735384 [Glomus cerebriforme]